MAYEKRICILKQIKKGFSADGNRLTGVVYAERMGEELTLTLKMPGLSPLREGRYVLVIDLGGKKYCFPVGEPMQLQNAPSVKDGFAALLCFVRSDAEPIAFGWCGLNRAEAPALLKALSETGRKKPIPTPLPPTQIPAPLQPNVPYAPGVPLPDKATEEGEAPFREKAYDDEAIAESDYYEPSHADEGAENSVQTETKKAAGGGDPAKDETAFLLPRRSLTYYKEVRDEIEAVLRKYPADTRLKWAFPHSDWARNESSLIGVIYEEGVPRYLCVASEELSAELKEHSVFVPASPFSDEQGFYVVFQDADTGAYVKVEET